jgi:hypothetical protein
MSQTLGSDVPGGEQKQSRMERVMRQESFTPQELADLLEMPLSHINHEAFSGRLKADIVNHDIVALHRADILDWMHRRGL